MSWYSIHDGVRTAYFDTDARMVTPLNPDGSAAGPPRAFTAVENTVADAMAAALVVSANEQLLLSRLRTATTNNLAEIDRLTTFSNGTVALTNTQRDAALRDLAGQQVRAFRQLNALMKYVGRDLTTLDGT